MARYTGPKVRLSRRLGVALTPKAARIMKKRSNPPGQHGDNGGRPRKQSEYGVQLLEKQKLRLFYGLMERQFRNTFDEAIRLPGVTGDNLLILLERRLDNVIYRLGLATTRAQARQLVTHGHITVNGRRVNIPSFRVKPGEVIGIHERSHSSPYFKELKGRNAPMKLNVPDWLDANKEEFTARIVAMPRAEHAEREANVQAIVEFYSR